MTKFGTLNNNKYVVTEVDISRENIEWSYLKRDVTDKQGFPFYLNIAFHEVEQDTKEFIPNVPNFLPKLPKVSTSF